MVSINLQIERTIYVNSLVPNSSYRILKKKLPREKKSYHLYEITLSEENFHQQFQDFDYFLTNPDIEGI
jgi:hypothetical protein